MARGNDLGIEIIVQFGGAFLVGWAASWLFDAYHVSCYPEPYYIIPHCVDVIN